MKDVDEGRPGKAPSSDSLTASVRDALARVVYARELLEDGDPALAWDVLNDLERDLTGQLSDTSESCRCPDCGLHFDWPGQLDHHQRFLHWRREAA